ncbi:hypothetical protein ACMGDM_15545 [Sphingomonas sp. DT-51]|uniref:hypothetical protein n=1 Tax=Sphingomonas sp. DT-51 TaxID=3396165 RepID=UPI003F1A48EB
MDLDFGSPAFFLLLTGGCALSLWNAVWRRDGSSTLAMSVAALGFAHLAGLPAWLLVWGWATLAIATTMSVVAVAFRWLAGVNAYRAAMIGTLAVTAALVAYREGALPSSAVPFGDQTLALASQVHRHVDALSHG